MKKMIYFDHAATSYPKPKTVTEAVSRAFSEQGGNPGRSGHQLSLSAAESIYNCREAVSNLFCFRHVERVVFTCSATHALNIAIQGLVSPDSHIITSNLEHNSVIRPLHALSARPGANITYSTFNAVCADDARLLQSFTAALRRNTRLAVVTIASNVCGKILPVAQMGEICRERGIVLIADGAQACGVVPLDFHRLNIDALCLPGHKGLYGPQGTGVLLLGENVEPESLIQGGNGVNSREPEMGGDLPERLEAGTMNTPGICGLHAGIKYLRGVGVETVFRHSSQLCTYLTNELKKIKGIRLYGECKKKVPVILLNKEGYTPEHTAQFLDQKGICVRGGLHCAPIAHSALQTEGSGAVRLSLGYTNTKKQADCFLEAICSLR